MAQKKKKRWIQKAIRSPGSFTAWAKRRGLSMSEAIAKGKKSKSSLIRKRANLAQTLRKIGKRRKRKK